MIIYKSYDDNFIYIWISIFHLMKNRRKIFMSSPYKFNVPSNIFSFVKIFFQIQISRQFIKQTIIWDARVFLSFFLFETLEIRIL